MSIPGAKTYRTMIEMAADRILQALEAQ